MILVNDDIIVVERFRTQSFQITKLIGMCHDAEKKEPANEIIIHLANTVEEFDILEERLTDQTFILAMVRCK